MGRRAFTRELAEANGLAIDRYPTTDDEARVAEEVLACDLNRLSLDDQENVVFDVHGLPCVDGGVGSNDENGTKSTQFLDDKLEELEKELQKIPSEKKSAYEHALYLNPDYVQGRTFRKQFLNSVNFDPSFAADQICQHFETKRSLFGNGFVLGRELLLSDLSEEDMKHLERSVCQVLPTRDVAGRVVLFCCPRSEEPRFTDSRVRRFFLFARYFKNRIECHCPYLKIYVSAS